MVPVVQSKSDVWKVPLIFDNEQVVHTSFCPKTSNLADIILGHFDSAAIIRRVCVVCIEAIYCEGCRCTTACGDAIQTCRTKPKHQFYDSAGRIKRRYGSASVYGRDDRVPRSSFFRHKVVAGNRYSVGSIA